MLGPNVAFLMGVECWRPKGPFVALGREYEPVRRDTQTKEGPPMKVHADGVLTGAITDRDIGMAHWLVSCHDLIREAARGHSNKRLGLAEHQVLSMLDQIGAPVRANLAVTA